MNLYLGIEIGGTKLQIGLGPADGKLLSLWRDNVNVARGGEGIREQILQAIPELIQQAKVERSQLHGVGIGFGGPIDDRTQSVIKSHQIEGWNDFPLAAWLSEALQLPCILGNDADVAGLAEAIHGAGQGLSPIFYMTIGSGIGGGFIVDGEIYRAVGRGAAEIGHLRILDNRPAGDQQYHALELLSSGWGIGNYARRVLKLQPEAPSDLRELGLPIEQIMATHVAQAAKEEDPLARSILEDCLQPIAEALASVIVLLCPRRIVIGGGVSFMGEDLFFQPLRRLVAERCFLPFVGLTEIVPASLGEEVVVHGALELAKRR